MSLSRWPWSLAAPFLLLLAGCRSEPPTEIAPDGSTAPDQVLVADGPTGCSPTDPRSVPVQVAVQPDEGEKAYVDLIGRAKKSIRVFAYLMGKGGILNGLKAQALKGLEVRVILDGGQTVNQAYQQELEAAGVQTAWSDPAFEHMHAKVLIADQTEALISTGNFSISYIGTERNFNARTSDPQDVATLVSLFDADWERRAPDLSCTRLLVAPVNSRLRLLDLIKGAQQTLIVESMQFADSDVREAVAKRHQAGVEVRVLLAAPAWISANTEAADYLKGEGIPVRWLATPPIHTKILVVDGKTAFLGSINLSYTSISKNREVGIIFEDAAAVQRMLSTFEQDWPAASNF